MDLWTEDELYELAKRIHPPHRRPSPPTLKDLCMDFTINRWQSWIELSKILGNNPFDKILPMLRNDLIDRLSASVDSFHGYHREFLLLLLNTDSKSLVLDKCREESSFHHEILPFLTEVVLRAPNLEFLSFSNFRIFFTRSCGFFPQEIKVPILRELVKLKKLKHLSLIKYFGLDNEDLRLITMNLKNLKCLRVHLLVDKIKVIGFQYVGGLDKLEEIHLSFGEVYQDDPSRYDEHVPRNFLDYTFHWIYSWCAQTIPNLKKIDVSLLSDERDFPRVISIFSGTSNMENITTNFYLPEATLPKLKILDFCGPIEDPFFFTKIATYGNLTTLKVKSIRCFEFDRILESIGSQLLNLNFDVQNHAVDYFKLFHLCPNLVKLNCMSRNGQILDSEFAERVTRKNFLRLEEIRCGSDNENFLKMPARFLKYVCTAPFIKKVIFYGFILENRDYNWLRDVEEGTFQTLEILNVATVRLELGCAPEDLGMMVKFLVCGAPKLEGVNVSFDESWHPTFQDRFLSNARKFLKLLKDKKGPQ